MPRNRRANPRFGPDRVQSLGSLRRTPGRRPPGKAILIVTEGAVTEPLYFTSLRSEYKLSVIDVAIVGEGASPITVVDRAITLREERTREVRRALRRGELAELAFDEVWCVFDVEVSHENASLARAIDRAVDRQINLAVSNPAFEFWLLLHFTDTTRSFRNADEVRRVLKDYDPVYEKNEDCFPRLRAHTTDAIARAERILRGAADNTFPHPSTTVYKLVQVIQGMGRR